MTTNPRSLISHNIATSTIEIDENLLDLNYFPPKSDFQWKPTRELADYTSLNKCYLDIETTGLDPETCRVIFIGLRWSSGKVLTKTSLDEKEILEWFLEVFFSDIPFALFFHNGFNFDLPFLERRFQINKVYGFPFKRDERGKTITAATYNGRPLEYYPYQMPGFNVALIDTLNQVCQWDKQAAKLDSYGLKNCCVQLELRDERRLELTNEQIQACWDVQELDTIREYLEFDLEDTELLADRVVPSFYYQLLWIPNLSFQNICTASPALKAQLVHQSLYPDSKPESDSKMSFSGGLVDCPNPGLYKDVAKIDVTSLYPNIMLNYRICSRKDPEQKFLAILQYMKDERIRLKKMKDDKAAQVMQESLKILINGSYGYLGTAGYSFNDFEAAALVTAYGRKIIKLMGTVSEKNNSVVIELDTDGQFFSNPDPIKVFNEVQKALPKGIEIELELKNATAYIPKSKSYIIVTSEGKIKKKGLFRKRNQLPLDTFLNTNLVELFAKSSYNDCLSFYQEIRQSLIDRTIDTSLLVYKRKISVSEIKLVDLGIGQIGEKVEFLYIEKLKISSRSGKVLGVEHVPSLPNKGKYSIVYYLDKVDKIFKNIFPYKKGIELVTAPDQQIPLFFV